MTQRRRFLAAYGAMQAGSALGSAVDGKEISLESGKIKDKEFLPKPTRLHSLLSWTKV